MRKVLFLTLKIFSATGGIEKVCRILGKALHEMSLRDNFELGIFSMHDRTQNAKGNRYFPAELFKGYGAAKSDFMLGAVKEGRRADLVVLSHANLLPAGWLIKKRSPKTRLMLLAHGIELWQPLSRLKLKMLRSCDLVVCVSAFTAAKIKELHGVDENKCLVLNNCIDPFLMQEPLLQGTRKGSPRAAMSAAAEALRHSYGIREGDTVLFTLTRLSSRERYKGYGHVLDALAEAVKRRGNLKYILAGQYDRSEKEHVEKKIQALGLSDHVRLTGFIAEEDLPAHFSLADIFLMPSVKEGFGLVFIEAMFYGLPVIAGNADGSRDALLNGKLGILVQPDSVHQIAAAIDSILGEPEKFSPSPQVLLANFGYSAYKEKLDKIFAVCCPTSDIQHPTSNI